MARMVMDRNVAGFIPNFRDPNIFLQTFPLRPCIQYALTKHNTHTYVCNAYVNVYMYSAVMQV